MIRAELLKLLVPPKRDMPLQAYLMWPTAAPHNPHAILADCSAWGAGPERRRGGRRPVGGDEADNCRQVGRARALRLWGGRTRNICNASDASDYIPDLCLLSWPTAVLRLADRSAVGGVPARPEKPSAGGVTPHGAVD